MPRRYDSIPGNTPVCYNRIMLSLLITGTDTGVGKTHAACLIARQLAERGLRVGIYKPVCSGAEITADGQPIWDDLLRLSQAVNVPAELDDICPQRFLASLAPPVAAMRESRRVDFAVAVRGTEPWRNRVDVLLIEGAGGWLCPLTETQTIADFAEAVQAPVLIVARPGLGTINHTLLTVDAIRRRDLPVAGVIFSQTTPEAVDESVATNGAEIERRGGVQVFGTIPFGNSTELLHGGIPLAVDWRRILRNI